MKNKVLLCCIALSMFFLVGCKSKKNMGSTNVSIDKVENNLPTSVNKVLNNTDSTYSARISINVEDLKISMLKSVSGSMKAKKGKFVLLSVTPLGFEVARILFTPQEFYVINRLDKTYCRQGYEAISSKNYNINYDIIEALICNRIYGSDFSIKEVSDGVYSCAFIDGKMESSFYIDESGHLNRTMIHSLDGKGNLFVEYGGFKNDFPGFVNIISDISGKNMSFQVGVSSISINDKLNDASPSISSSYKLVSFDSMIQGF